MHLSAQTCNNVALNKTGTFTQNGTTVPLAAAVLDGSTTAIALTFDGYQNVPSFYIDLGGKYDLSKIVFNWGSINKPSSYTVSTSSDNVIWATSVVVVDNVNSLDTRSFVAPYVRYLKITSINRVSPYTIDLYEIQVCGVLTACTIDIFYKNLTVGENALINMALNATTINAGTTNAGALYTTKNCYFKYGNTSLMDVTSSSVKIYKKLTVDNTLEAEELDVKAISATNLTLKMNNLADYVFKPGYQLRSLSSVEDFILKNNHLPDMPSAASVKESGINVAEMNNLLLQKVEELTLYIIELKKENEAIKSEVKNLTTKIQ
jgi:hypothetical protein